MTITALAAQRLAAQRRLVRALRLGSEAPNAPIHVQQLLQERRDRNNVLLAELIVARRR
ncbi:MAG: hypothetical protein JWN96_2281 [Mycobacterium sp.]|nr:hypothetical protein [Mycobacterium sp.]